MDTQEADGDEARGSHQGGGRGHVLGTGCLCATACRGISAHREACSGRSHWSWSRRHHVPTVLCREAEEQQAHIPEGFDGWYAFDEHKEGCRTACLPEEHGHRCLSRRAALSPRER